MLEVLKISQLSVATTKCLGSTFCTHQVCWNLSKDNIIEQIIWNNASCCMNIQLATKESWMNCIAASSQLGIITSACPSLPSWDANPGRTILIQTPYTQSVTRPRRSYSKHSTYLGCLNVSYLSTAVHCGAPADPIAQISDAKGQCEYTLNFNIPSRACPVA